MKITNVKSETKTMTGQKEGDGKQKQSRENPKE
jgi:hypothetical protein